MMKEAELHAEEDKTRKDEIETRNRADQAVYGGEKMLQDMGEKLAAEDKSAMAAAVESLKTALTGNDGAGMNTAMEQLTQVQHKAAEAMYKQADAAGGPEGTPEAAGAAPGAAAGEAAGGASGDAEGDVIDAEVVDEEKK